MSESPSSHRAPRQRSRAVIPASFLAGCVLAGVATALLSGWLWVVLASPPQVHVTSNGNVYPTELQYTQIAASSLWFLAVGLVLGFLAGLALGWYGARYGAWVIIGTLLLCGIATAGAGWLGLHLFGGGAGAQQVQAAAGEGTVPLGVHLDTWVAYLGSPIGGLAGAVLATWVWFRRHRANPDPVPG